ncbi:hydantoinase/oxoprolinase family protein [Microbacterium pygmaeum]|uniref:N-methylhydantoinase A n=1 Tax=Microbacterium pygmaeum TaxID=370764 RepID=A0A1G7XD16_9MICO|nr:hydantoinase/oxoprolinase family protein [Microbacterium pygmaeum]SDG81951.1 N-methylhydantoinase A [Microbacterium pygmaeum]
MSARAMIAVDVGGTFTDVVAIREGKIETAKVSTSYTSVCQPVLDGAQLLGVDDAIVFNHASTHGLNAVITRRLPKVAFLTTEGHRDMLDIGRVWRPSESLLDPNWRRSFGDAARPLVPRYLRRGVRERTLADGTALFELDEGQARAQLEVLKKCDVEGVAICLLNSYVSPVHEIRLRELVYEVLGADIACSISSEVSPLAKEYPRASTTVIDAFMKIIYRDYTSELQTGLTDLGFDGELNFADCAATLVPVDRAMEFPYRIVFSGPSAGTVASAHFGAMIGQDQLLCADIGGTSCDISVVTGGRPTVNTSFELEHDLIVNALANDITAIAAGGGSLVTIGPTGELRVGPTSAGSDPGPACYGRGGTQPTTTDICVMIGIIEPGEFAGGEVHINRDLSRQAFEGLDTEFSLAQRVRYAYEMAVNNISEGLFNVAIKHGVDPRDFSVVAYGAAGPMLLPATMDTLHCKQVIVPPHPGLFSALGLLSADQVFTVNRSSYTILSADAAEHINAIFAEMEAEMLAGLDASVAVTFERTFDGHLVGQSWDTPFVPVPDGALDAGSISEMIAAFHDTYEERSGNRFEQVAVEGVTFRINAILDTPKVEYPALAARTGDALAPVRQTTIRYLGDLAVNDGEQIASVYDRDDLRAGDVIEGPAIISERLSTTFISSGQVASVGPFGELIITKE